MINFFSKYRIIFYFVNFLIIILYIFPGSLLGCIFIDDCDTQPQITSNFFIISSNHFYIFVIISLIGFATFKKKEIKSLIIYLLCLAVFLEITHLLIPVRSFQLEDIFGNLLGVIVVIFINKFINKYGIFKN